MKKSNIELLPFFLVLFGALVRLLPHPANFVPIGALALFGGTYLKRKYGLFVPLLAMFVSDIFIGFYNIWLMASVYLGFLLIVILGFWLKKHKKWYFMLGSSLFGSIIFYLITNFAVWAFSSWYPKTFSGLLLCYFMALPFFRNTLLGDLFYVSILFGSYELIYFYLKEKRLAYKKVN